MKIWKILLPCLIALVVICIVCIIVFTQGASVNMDDEKAETTAADNNVIVSVEKANTNNTKTNEQTKQTVEKNKPDESKKKEEEEKKKEEERKKAEEQKRIAEERKKRDAVIFNSDHMVEDDWFDDVLFVGDSVTSALAAYSEDYERFGNAEFLCIPSLGYNSSLWDLQDPNNVHPLWKGKKVTVDMGVKLSKKHKIFIMFGMNDVGTWGVDQSIESMKELTDRIIEKSPDVELYIQGGTPMLKSVEKSNLNNLLMTQFNEGLKSVCQERGYHFIDITPAVCDEEGALIADYCMDPDDMGMHLNYDGCERWVKYLMAHVLDDGDPTPYTPETFGNGDEEYYIFIDETQESSEEEPSEDVDSSSDENNDDESSDQDDEYYDYDYDDDYNDENYDDDEDYYGDDYY